MDMFGKQVNLHRVPIINDNGEVIGIVSQSRVAEFLYQNLAKFPTLANRQLKDWLKQPTATICTISITDKALDAFKMMIEQVR